MFAYCRCGSDIIIAAGGDSADNKSIERSTDLGTTWAQVYTGASGVSNILCVIYVH